VSGTDRFFEILALPPFVDYRYAWTGKPMPLNKACIGKQYPPIENVVTLEAIQKFARAYNHANPFFFDASKAGTILAPPMFGVTWVVPSTERVVDHDAELQVDTLHLVHGEQEFEFVRPVSPGEVIATTAAIASIETKSTGEVLAVESISRDRGGEIVQRAVFSAFIRSGGSGRPSGSVRQPEPDHSEPPMFIQREPTTAEMPLRYAEATGDWHQIHLDPQAAAKAGLPGVIVHGLCTLALCSKPFIERLSAGDPRRLKRLHARFIRPVFPGQTIDVKVWAAGGHDGRQTYDFEVTNPEGQIVLRNGIAELQS
jgi:acyl dehydratase